MLIRPSADPTKQTSSRILNPPCMQPHPLTHIPSQKSDRKPFHMEPMETQLVHDQRF